MRERERERESARMCMRRGGAERGETESRWQCGALRGLHLRNREIEPRSDTELTEPPGRPTDPVRFKNPILLRLLVHQGVPSARPPGACGAHAGEHTEL